MSRVVVSIHTEITLDDIGETDSSCLSGSARYRIIKPTVLTCRAWDRLTLSALGLMSSILDMVMMIWFNEITLRDALHQSTIYCAFN